MYRAARVSTASSGSLPGKADGFFAGRRLPRRLLKETLADDVNSMYTRVATLPGRTCDAFAVRQVRAETSARNGVREQSLANI